MFKKILIANRGEIACRIMRTAHDMGISTVAVYSDVDANAMHVRQADEACHIGASTAAESYLNIGKIIEAAKTSGAQAIHPGYGFLSENPEFVEAVEAAGLVFIGPSAMAIRAMGLKDAAKVLMEASGVPVVPGYHGENQDAKFLKQQAAEIGYPVMIKARAGGGGKGMRLVENAKEFDQALAGAVREGSASFGDGHVLIEKYISSPRHIEIQVFGDSHGNVVHLFERDCSLQRRHQKVIEEAPAPGMNDEMRAAMGAAAVKAAKAVDYCGAGTVEFIVDGTSGLSADKFWFMEMNTRLQVEHPVTEMITGLDLVELQLNVADGEPLGFAQEDLAIDGWAFEARIYAEDVVGGFLPCTGTLEYYSTPDDLARFDAGVDEGDEISPFYDPMIAKVVVHGETRELALEQLRTALSECHIAGVTTNIAFLAALASNDDFRKGKVDTGLIERDMRSLLASGSPDETQIAIGALVAATRHGPFGKSSSWRHWGKGTSYVDLNDGENEINCSVEIVEDNRFLIAFGDNSVELAVANQDAEIGSIEIVSEDGQVDIVPFVSNNTVTIMGNANAFTWTIIDPLESNFAETKNLDAIYAPMPGLVKIIQVSAGDKVDEGQVLVVLEAMKMEHSLVAPRDGEISEIHIEQGSQITDGALLVSMDEQIAD